MQACHPLVGVIHFAPFLTGVKQGSRMRRKPQKTQEISRFDVFGMSESKQKT